MKYKLLFTPETMQTCARQISLPQLRFLAWLLEGTTHNYIHRANFNCSCGEPFWFIASREGKDIKGNFCIKCAFKEIPFLCENQRPLMIATGEFADLKIAPVHYLTH